MRQGGRRGEKQRGRKPGERVGAQLDRRKGRDPSQGGEESVRKRRCLYAQPQELGRGEKYFLHCPF